MTKTQYLDFILPKIQDSLARAAETMDAKHPGEGWGDAAVGRETLEHLFCAPRKLGEYRLDIRKTPRKDADAFHRSLLTQFNWHAGRLGDGLGPLFGAHMMTPKGRQEQIDNLCTLLCHVLGIGSPTVDRWSRALRGAA